MVSVTNKLIRKFDDKYGRNWIKQDVIESLGGVWPLQSGWRHALVGNKVDIEKVEDLISKHIPKKSNFKFDGIKKSKTEIELTEEQMHCASEISKLKKKVQTLGGLAGTGKTTVISYLMRKMSKFTCCAFTGKAAEVLRSKDVDAQTIHSLIYSPTDEKTADGDPIFIKKDSLGDIKGIIVDEASMVGPMIYKDLLTFNLPIIFVGDHGQLEPVGEDVHLMKNPDFKLETIHRNAGDIAKFAHHLRNGFLPIDFEPTEKVKIIYKKDCVEYLLNVDQIICARNDTRVAINRYVRSLRGETDDIPVKGDRIISLMNSKKLGIYNGSQGEINSVSTTRLSAFFNNRLVKMKFDLSTFHSEKTVRDIKGVQPLDYAYAITAHKSQGSEWEKVLVIEQICSLWDHKRWAYTAASRAREQLVWAMPDK